MTSALKIYINRLKDGYIEKILETLPADFLEIKEKDLLFSEPIQLQGEAYLADVHLVICLKINTSALIPCLICNTPVKIPLCINHFYHTESLSELKNPIFDYGSLLREAILLQTPHFVECQKGNCPERKTVTKYLRPPEQTSQIPHHYPFSDLQT